MTHPLTPREKVELKPCPFCGGANLAFTAPCSGGGIGVLCRTCHTNMDSRCESEDGAAEAWNRRTALASGSGDHAGDATNMIGSGDHAELARLAEASKAAWPDGKWFRDYELQYGERGQIDGPDAAFIAAANPATVLALLAEIAALRAERDQARALHNRATDRSRHWEIASINADNRATEAERKLAEDTDIFVELTLHHNLTPAMKDRIESLMISRETTND